MYNVKLTFGQRLGETSACRVTKGRWESLIRQGSAGSTRYSPPFILASWKCLDTDSLAELCLSQLPPSEWKFISGSQRVWRVWMSGSSTLVQVLQYLRSALSTLGTAQPIITTYCLYLVTCVERYLFGPLSSTEYLVAR